MNEIDAKVICLQKAFEVVERKGYTNATLIPEVKETYEKLIRIIKLN